MTSDELEPFWKELHDTIETWCDPPIIHVNRWSGNVPFDHGPQTALLELVMPDRSEVLLDLCAECTAKLLSRPIAVQKRSEWPPAWTQKETGNV